MFNSGKFLACCVYIATLQVELLMLTVVGLCSDARRCSLNARRFLPGFLSEQTSRRQRHLGRPLCLCHHGTIEPLAGTIECIV